MAAGGRGLPPHVEHHRHRTAVSRGAEESLSSAPTGIKPGAENWDLTVRAVTSCSAHLLLLIIIILLLIDCVLYDNIALSSTEAYVRGIVLLSIRGLIGLLTCTVNTLGIESNPVAINKLIAGISDCQL